MSSQFNDFAQRVEDPRAVVSPKRISVGARTRRRRSAKDWRSDEVFSDNWASTAVVIALVGIGAGVLGQGALLYLFPAVPAASTAILWSVLVATTLTVFSRGTPSGLMRFRGRDLLWGTGGGLLLRLLQGWVSRADESPFPSIESASGAPAPSWWLSDVLPAGIVGPFVEEFYFRAVLLVAIYLVLRRKLGSPIAGTTALVLSVGAFVLLHGLRGGLVLAEGLMLFAVGSAGALLVLSTGRLWGAVLLHVLYNISYLALVFVGTTLA